MRAPDTLDSVQEHLRLGGLLAYPTETVYGFGGLPIRSVIDTLMELKKRDLEKPMLLLVPDREAVSDLTWTPEAIELAEVFWPGSVTLVLADPGSRYPEGVRGSDGSVAVRVSPHPLAQELGPRCGWPHFINQRQSSWGDSGFERSERTRRCPHDRGGRGHVGSRRGSPGALPAVYDHRLFGTGAGGSYARARYPWGGSAAYFLVSKPAQPVDPVAPVEAVATMTAYE